MKDDRSGMRRRTSSRNRRSAGGVEKAGDIVAGLLARRGYAQVESASVAAAAWHDAAGANLAGETRPGHVRRGVLEVTVRSSAVLQELTFIKQELLRGLANRLPEQNITDVRFRVGPVD